MTTEAHCGTGRYCGTPCHCGCDTCFPPPELLPAWVVPGAVFALDSRTYRVVGLPGRTNQRNRTIFERFVFAEPVNAEPWEGLPEAPCAKADVAASLKHLFTLPRFFAEQLARAIYVVPADRESP